LLLLLLLLVLQSVTVASQLLVLLPPHEFLDSCQRHVLLCHGNNRRATHCGTSCTARHCRLLLLGLPGLAGCLLPLSCSSRGRGSSHTDTFTAATSSRGVRCEQQRKWQV
jgi:hypothetical protein